MPIEAVISTLFAPEREARAPWLVRTWLAGLFVAGLIGWSYLLGWGTAPLDFHDWTAINLPRLLFVQNALAAGEWPLHMAGTAALHGVTDRFLTLPDVITTPQTLLLLVLPLPAFVVADVLIFFSAGFAGLLLLRRHFNWSLAAFSAVFLLFLFNGHILAHYSVGHFTWGPYFLFPLIALLLFRFLDGDDSWRAIGWFAAVMCVMVLAGGQHHMTWVLLLLALLVPFCWNRAWWLIAAAVASGLLSAVRLLPPALELPSFRSAGLVSDVIGYPSVTHLLIALVSLRRESPAFNPALPGNMWFFDSAYYEFTAYIGIVGAALVAWGLYRWLRDEHPLYHQLIVPAFAMTALSIGSLYRVVRLTQLPMLEAERYAARMFSLPLSLFIFMAAVAVDRHFKQAAVSIWHRALALVALAFVALDIAASLRLWRVRVSSGLFGHTELDAAMAAVASRPDPVYVNTVLAGLAISIVTAIALLVLAQRERQRNRLRAIAHNS
jgi:hypothetical protein